MLPTVLIQTARLVGAIDDFEAMMLQAGVVVRSVREKRHRGGWVDQIVQAMGV